MDPGGRILEVRAAMVPGEECVVPLEGVSRRFGACARLLHSA